MTLYAGIMRQLMMIIYLLTAYNSVDKVSFDVENVCLSINKLWAIDSGKFEERIEELTAREA